MYLPLELWHIIFYKLDIISKINLLQVNRTLNNLELDSFINNISFKYYIYRGYYIYENPNISHLITTNMLINNHNILMLNISDNNKIKDKDIINLKKLKHLYVNYCISDEGIKHMNLHTLYASGNSKISDEGIKHMNLHTLYASYNSKITNKYNNILYLHK